MQQDSDPPQRDLESLPLRKRRELELILRILFESFEEATRTKLKPERRRGRILAVLLFGSQARGTAVEDRKSGFVSDYDILVVVNHEDLTDLDYWEEAEERLVEMRIRGHIRREASVIFHTLQDVNDQLARGRFFFMDIIREAIPLYKAARLAFAEPQPLTPEVAHEEALGYFETRLPSASRFLSGAGFYLEQQGPNEAAFSLHQAAERAYLTLLLTFTLYAPHSHNLEFLHKQCLKLDDRLFEVWGENGRMFHRRGRFGKRCFELVKKAYVEARYSKHYRITKEELAYITERVGALIGLADTICREKLGLPPPDIPPANPAL